MTFSKVCLTVNSGTIKNSRSLYVTVLVVHVSAMLILRANCDHTRQSTHGLHLDILINIHFKFSGLIELCS